MARKINLLTLEAEQLATHITDSDQLSILEILKKHKWEAEKVELSEQIADNAWHSLIYHFSLNQEVDNKDYIDFLATYFPQILFSFILTIEANPPSNNAWNLIQKRLEIQFAKKENLAQDFLDYYTELFVTTDNSTKSIRINLPNAALEQYISDNNRNQNSFFNQYLGFLSGIIRFLLGYGVYKSLYGNTNSFIASQLEELLETQSKISDLILSIPKTSSDTNPSPEQKLTSDLAPQNDSVISKVDDIFTPTVQAEQPTSFLFPSLDAGGVPTSTASITDYSVLSQQNFFVTNNIIQEDPQYSHISEIPTLSSSTQPVQEQKKKSVVRILFQESSNNSSQTSDSRIQGTSTNLSAKLLATGRQEPRSPYIPPNRDRYSHSQSAQETTTNLSASSPATGKQEPHSPYITPSRALYSHSQNPQETSTNLSASSPATGKQEPHSPYITPSWDLYSPSQSAHETPSNLSAASPATGKQEPRSPYITPSRALYSHSENPQETPTNSSAKSPVTGKQESSSPYILPIRNPYNHSFNLKEIFKNLSAKSLATGQQEPHSPLTTSSNPYDDCSPNPTSFFLTTPSSKQEPHPPTTSSNPYDNCSPNPSGSFPAAPSITQEPHSPPTTSSNPYDNCSPNPSGFFPTGPSITQEPHSPSTTSSEQYVCSPNPTGFSPTAFSITQEQQCQSITSAPASSSFTVSLTLEAGPNGNIAYMESSHDEQKYFLNV